MTYGWNGGNHSMKIILKPVKVMELCHRRLGHFNIDIIKEK